MGTPYTPPFLKLFFSHTSTTLKNCTFCLLLVSLINSRRSGILPQKIHHQESERKAGSQWLTPVLLATWEAEIRRMVVGSDL
jgi:hypothetical protein